MECGGLSPLSELADLSASEGASSARFRSSSGGLFAFDGDKSPLESGDESPHSRGLGCGGLSFSFITHLACVSRHMRGYEAEPLSDWLKGQGAMAEGCGRVCGVRRLVAAFPRWPTCRPATGVWTFQSNRRRGLPITLSPPVFSTLSNRPQISNKVGDKDSPQKSPISGRFPTCRAATALRAPNLLRSGAFRSTTATSRLHKAVTSHRTP